MLDRFANFFDIEPSQEIHSVMDHFLFPDQCVQLCFNSSLFLVIEPIFEKEISALKIVRVEMLPRTYSREGDHKRSRGHRAEFLGVFLPADHSKTSTALVAEAKVKCTSFVRETNQGFGVDIVLFGKHHTMSNILNTFTKDVQ